MHFINFHIHDYSLYSFKWLLSHGTPVNVPLAPGVPCQSGSSKTDFLQDDYVIVTAYYKDDHGEVNSGRLIRKF